jgi:hypothetical protein
MEVLHPDQRPVGGVVEGPAVADGRPGIAGDGYRRILSGRGGAVAGGRLPDPAEGGDHFFPV